MESSRFVFLVRPIFELFGNSDERAMTFVIRKAAHFSEYVVLTFLASGCARAWFAQSAACARAVLAVWIMTPLIDETIQGFVPGRDPRVMDVCIDLAGGLLGMLIARKTLRRGDAKLRGNC